MPQTTVKLGKTDHLRGYVRAALEDLVRRGVVKPGDDFDDVARRLLVEFGRDFISDARHVAMEMLEPVVVSKIRQGAESLGDILGNLAHDFFSRARGGERK